MKIKRKDLEKLECALNTALLAKRPVYEMMWALGKDDSDVVVVAALLAADILDGRR